MHSFIRYQQVQPNIVIPQTGIQMVIILRIQVGKHHHLQEAKLNIFFHPLRRVKVIQEVIESMEKAMMMMFQYIVIAYH